MKLVRFEAKQVHGFIDFDIRFNDDLTFLTGINGSGKTTALNSIAALLAPDLSVLCNLDYDFLQLWLEVDGAQRWIYAKRDTNGAVLSISTSEERIVLRRYIADFDQSVTQQSANEASYYREVASSLAGNPAFDFILSLPSPMFLGLDRRSRSDDDFARRYVPVRNRAQKNVFSNSLTASLRAAVRLAEDNRKSALIASGRVAEDLQREILLGLLAVDVEGAAGYPAMSVPTLKDIQELDQLRKLVNSLPQVLNVSREDVVSRVSPLFDKLEDIIKLIPEGVSLNKIISGNARPEVLNALFAWSGSQSQLRRIRALQGTVAKYNRRRARYLDVGTKYLSLINKFLGDSFKRVEFDNNGDLGVVIENQSSKPKDITSLSSGEAQIFVIITQLSFNRLAAQDNVFIIDEPELSLHVDWQEIFVDSIQQANPNVQFVLASHSPSIILDRLSKCVDITPIKRKAPANLKKVND